MILKDIKLLTFSFSLSSSLSLSSLSLSGASGDFEAGYQTFDLFLRVHVFQVAPAAEAWPQQLLLERW